MTALPLVFDAPKRALPPRHLADLDPADRRAAVGELGLPGFRADQLSRHYFGRLTADVEAMTDVPAAAREGLAALLPPLVTPVTEQTCDGGTTRKTLWRGHDGTLAESVLMGYPDRATACISSQAGCGMACPFCATGQGGLERNLSTAEIVDQVRQAAAAARDGALGEPTRLSNVVFMGMGEPLANYKRVVAALRRIIDPAPGRARDLRARRHGLDRRARPGHRQAGRRGHSRHPRRLPARAGRRAARHAGPRQQPLEGRRGPRRRPPLRDHDGAPRLDRVRPDPRRQRPAVARGPARQAPAAADRDEAGARQPHPAQPHPGEPLGRLAARGAGRVRPPRAGRRCRVHRPRHPWAGDRRGLRPARR